MPTFIYFFFFCVSFWGQPLRESVQFSQLVYILRMRNIKTYLPRDIREQRRTLDSEAIQAPGVLTNFECFAGPGPQKQKK